VEGEHEAVAASEDHQVVTGDREGDATFRDSIGGLQDGAESGFPEDRLVADGVKMFHGEAAEEGRVAAVVCAEAGAEAGVGGEAAPAPGDGAGAGKGGGIRREAEENLREKVVVFQRRRRRREAGRAHAGCDVVDLEGTQGRRITFFFDRKDTLFFREEEGYGYKSNRKAHYDTVRERRALQYNPPGNSVWAQKPGNPYPSSYVNRIRPYLYCIRTLLGPSSTINLLHNLLSTTFTSKPDEPPPSHSIERSPASRISYSPPHSVATELLRRFSTISSSPASPGSSTSRRRCTLSP
jgi:hypothetical protein